jgi:hypothetical protein
LRIADWDCGLEDREGGVAEVRQPGAGRAESSAYNGRNPAQRAHAPLPAAVAR